MSLKVKLISTISLFMLMLGALILGVYAATQQQISIQGNLSFVVPDRSLFVKEVRYQEAGGEEIVVDSFTPGYINGNFNMDLTSLETEENGHGSFTLYFDIINATDILWSIESVDLGALANDGVSERHGGIIGVNELTDADGDGFKEFDPATTQADGTLTLTIMAPNSARIDLSEITVTIDEAQPDIIAISSDETLGQAQGAFAEYGDEVTISADFVGVDADFLGWKTSLEAEDLVSYSLDYTFTFTEESPTTYYAIFETVNSNLTYRYTTSSGTASVSDCNTSATEVTIPSAIYRSATSPYEFSVTSIGGSAFWGCSSLASITIPEGVTSIGQYAFYQCSSLTSITIPEGVTSIGTYAFYNCSSLTSIEIPEGVTSILEAAFRGCSSLTSIEIPEGVTSIGRYAFSGCSNLTSITIPTSVTSIGGRAFEDCDSLEYKVDEEGVSYLGNDNTPYIYLVDAPTTITNYTIKDTCIAIGYRAFYQCSSLTSITILEGVTIIDDSAFFICSNLESITIPDSVTSIGSQSFQGCSSLRSITIPDSVTSIASMAFNGCSNLTSITIPDSVTRIGARTFEDCSSLTSITIPDSVTSIDARAFYNCSNLTNITIPGSVTSIGSATFDGCSNLTNVTFDDPDGWGYSSSISGSDLTAITDDLSNPTTAATCLKTTYCQYYWFKN